MDLQITPQPLSGTVRIPSSKSYSHRAIICASLAEGKSLLSGIDFSVDLHATMDIMHFLGCSDITQHDHALIIEGCHRAIDTTAIADCKESGSTLRFLIPIAAALGIPTEFRGKGRLPQRPITPYIRELSQKGIHFTYNNTLPFTMQGKLQGGVFSLEGDISSQFITGLLLALPLLEVDSEIHMLSPLQSKPYADMTIDCMLRFGVMVEEIKDGYHIRGGQHYRPCDMHIEGDFSQAAFFYVANAIGNSIILENIPEHTCQGDRAIVDVIAHMESLRSQGKEACFTVDASDVPDLVPILAVLGCFGDCPSRITGAQRLKIKESDRLESTANMIHALGGCVHIHEDGLKIFPVESFHGGTVDSCGDHRIVMCAAICATRATEPVFIKGADSITKSYPTFFDDYTMLGGKTYVINLE